MSWISLNLLVRVRAAHRALKRAVLFGQITTRSEAVRFTLLCCGSRRDLDRARRRVHLLVGAWALVRRTAPGLRSRSCSDRARTADLGQNCPNNIMPQTALLHLHDKTRRAPRICDRVRMEKMLSENRNTAILTPRIGTQRF